MIYLKLFLSFLQVGMFSFGGGMAALPLIQRQVVDINSWLTLTEFSDLVTISEMTPGPIAVNSATFVGIQIAGIGGAIVATLGCILPSCIIVSLLAWLYAKYKDLKLMQGALDGLRPGVIALIASAGIALFELSIWGEKGFSLSLGSINFVSVILFAVALFVLRKFKLSPIIVMLTCGVLGGATYLLLDMV